MNKSELISAMVEKTGLTVKEAEKALAAFIESVTEELSKGGKVQLIGFGTFERTNREARTGRNPQTGKPITIKASKNAKFSPGKALKDAINQ